MKKHIYFIGIALLVIVSFSIFTLYMSFTRTIPIQTIEIKLLPTPLGLSTDTIINKQDLDNMAKEINENILVKDQNKLIETFEKERSKYIELLTIVSILLTIFNLFSLSTIFFDRSEIEKIKKDMNQKIELYDFELDKVKWQNNIYWIQNVIRRFDENARMNFKDRTIVDTDEKLQKYVLLKLKNFLDNIKSSDLDDDEKCHLISIELANYLKSVFRYRKKKFLVDSIFDVEKDRLFNDIIIQLFHKFTNICFSKIQININIMIPGINWGCYNLDK